MPGISGTKRVGEVPKPPRPGGPDLNYTTDSNQVEKTRARFPPDAFGFS